MTDEGLKDLSGVDLVKHLIAQKKAEGAADADRARRELAPVVPLRPEPEPKPEPEPEWKAQLEMSKDGIRNTLNNTRRILENSDEYAGKLTYNEFSRTLLVGGRPIADNDVTKARLFIEAVYGYKARKDEVSDVIEDIALSHSFHPVKAYLRSISWDGERRLEAMSKVYFGADGVFLGIPIHSVLVHKWMIAAVQRAFDPGCKVDSALMLAGDEGQGKSSFFRILGGDWFSDSQIDVGSKDAAMQLRSAWIYEMSELENMTRSRTESQVKAFMTVQVDQYRAPYGRHVQAVPRSSIFGATTNKRQFINEESGDRRSWIVPMRQALPDALLRELRDQLWAEAVARADADEMFHLTPEEREALKLSNAEYREQDPWMGAVSKFLHCRQEVTSEQVLTEGLNVPIERLHRGDQMRVASMLRQLGWEQRPRAAMADGRVARIWVPS